MQWMCYYIYMRWVVIPDKNSATVTAVMLHATPLQQSTVVHLHLNQHGKHSYIYHHSSHTTQIRCGHRCQTAHYIYITHFTRSATWKFSNLTSQHCRMYSSSYVTCNTSATKYSSSPTPQPTWQAFIYIPSFIAHNTDTMWPSLPDCTLHIYYTLHTQRHMKIF